MLVKYGIVWLVLGLVYCSTTWATKDREILEQALDDVAELTYPAFSPAQRMERVTRFRAKQAKFKPASVGDCSSGIGLTCGAFPLPDNMKTNPTKNRLQPIYPTTWIPFSVYDANGVAKATKVTDQYGNLLDYPTTRKGKGAQTAMGWICPTTPEAAAASPLRVFRNNDAAYLRSLGMWLPDSNTTTIAVAPADQYPNGWDFLTDSPGWGFVGQEGISRAQGIASQGVCVQIVMIPPADDLPTATPAIVDQNRIIAHEKGIQAFDTIYPGIANTQRGQVTGFGQSIGGEAADVAYNGWVTQDIKKPRNPLYGGIVSWDSSYEFYASGKQDFPGFSIDRVWMHSQTTGLTLGFGARGHRMNLNLGINSVVNTHNTTHPQGCVPDSCLWAIAAVQTGAWANLAAHNQPDYWMYPNQTYLSMCAPAGHNQIVGPTTLMPIQDLVNIQWEFIMPLITARRLGSNWASIAFSRARVDQLQIEKYQGQSLFTYHSNQVYGPDVLGGCIQGLQMARAETFYLFSYVSATLEQIENSEFFDPTRSDNVQSSHYGNYCDCIRNGQPCTAFINTYTCGNNTCAQVPQVPTTQLALYPGNNCPNGIC